VEYVIQSCDQTYFTALWSYGYTQEATEQKRKRWPRATQAS